MDVFAHTLWTNALYYPTYAHKRRMRLWAMFFGLLPDLIAFTPAFFYIVLNRRFVNPALLTDTSWTLRYAEYAYNFSHSLVVFAALLLGVTVIGNVIVLWRSRGDALGYRFWFYWPLLGWLLHILIDIPTHPDFYRTPLLYPLSNFHVSGGISWADPIFMVVNYSVILLVYLGWYFLIRPKNKSYEQK